MVSVDSKHCYSIVVIVMKWNFRASEGMHEIVGCLGLYDYQRFFCASVPLNLAVLVITDLDVCISRSTNKLLVDLLFLFRENSYN